MAGSTHAEAIERLSTLRTVRALADDFTEGLRWQLYDAVRYALDEGVSVSAIARALSIKRQTANELVRRVTDGR